jgi:hypothetical protein
MSHLYRVIWEDVAKKRDVEVAISYRMNEGAVTIVAVTPTKVTLHADRKVLACTRAMGQRILKEAYLASRDCTVTLEEEVLSQHLLMDETPEPAAV